MISGELKREKCELSLCMVRCHFVHCGESCDLKSCDPGEILQDQNGEVVILKVRKYTFDVLFYLTEIGQSYEI